MGELEIERKNPRYLYCMYSTIRTIGIRRSRRKPRLKPPTKYEFFSAAFRHTGSKSNPNRVAFSSSTRGRDRHATLDHISKLQRPRNPALAFSLAKKCWAWGGTVLRKQ